MTQDAANTKSQQSKQMLRSLPSISSLLERPDVSQWLAEQPRSVVVEALQSSVDAAREAVIQGEVNAAPTADQLCTHAHAIMHARLTHSLRRVINATGVVLHTGLGRAPLSEAAVEAMVECASGYSNLEIDLDSGVRGKRQTHVSGLLRELTGAEAATVVNNNAAATLLILNTLAKDREVIVSRGQLVEIGGSYRLPDVMTAGGAIMKEVGTTNRTRITDYERAITEETEILLHVHTSNYRVIGFTHSTSVEDLVELAKTHNKLVVDDLGSGALFDLTQIGLPHEPDVKTSIEAGADLVCFSGDKILGGPQAGIIVGRADLIRAIEANPLMRTYRVDKTTFAALEATLRQYLDTQHAIRTIPSLAMLSADEETLQRRAKRLCRMLSKQLDNELFEIVADVSVAGGGSLPGIELNTRCVAWKPTSISIDTALTQLRTGHPSILARTGRDNILFDLRTLYDKDFQDLANRLTQLISK